jgi:hypothetical protein
LAGHVLDGITTGQTCKKKKKKAESALARNSHNTYHSLCALGLTGGPFFSGNTYQNLKPAAFH